MLPKQPSQQKAEKAQQKPQEDETKTQNTDEKEQNVKEADQTTVDTIKVGKVTQEKAQEGNRPRQKSVDAKGKADKTKHTVGENGGSIFSHQT